MANILLIATGGTRAPTQIELAETFIRDGHSVRLVASANALRFLAAYLFRNPSKFPLYLRHYRAALREKLAYYQAKPREVPHIAEGKWCDVVVMAPATCNSMGKLASGIGDNYPLQVLRAVPRTRRVIVVPSMNPEMWYDPQCQRNIDLLNATEKYRVLCPTRGQMLSGDFGIGAQVSLQQIVTETYRTLGLVGLGTSGVRGIDTVPWAEQPLSDAETGNIVLVDPESAARAAVSEALRLEYPHLTVHGFGTATEALNWLHTNRAVAVFTELDFPEGVTGWDLIHRLRRPGCEQTQVIATSRRSRQDVGAESLGRLDVVFVPKPFSVPFVVGLIAGAIRAGAPRRDALPTRTLVAGERLFAQGEVGRQAYIVRSGRLRLTRSEHGHDVEVGIAEVGEMAGELSVVDGSQRAATATALETTEVQVLDLDNMRRYLETQPAWLRLTLDSVVGHLRETTERLMRLEEQYCALQLSARPTQQSANVGSMDKSPAKNRFPINPTTQADRDGSVSESLSIHAARHIEYVRDVCSILQAKTKAGFRIDALLCNLRKGGLIHLRVAEAATAVDEKIVSDATTIAQALGSARLRLGAEELEAVHRDVEASRIWQGLHRMASEPNSTRIVLIGDSIIIVKSAEIISSWNKSAAESDAASILNYLNLQQLEGIRLRA